MLRSFRCSNDALCCQGIYLGVPAAMLAAGSVGERLARRIGRAQTCALFKVRGSALARLLAPSRAHSLSKKHVNTRHQPQYTVLF